MAYLGWAIYLETHSYAVKNGGCRSRLRLQSKEHMILILQNEKEFNN